MDSQENKYYIFTEFQFQLFTSLQRYSRYILSQELKTFSKSELLTASDTILVHQDERELPELLNFLANRQDVKIVVVGFDDSAFLNLIDLSNLKNNLEQIISSVKLNSTQLFTEEELKEKLKNFFHSHGEDSLFEYLNLAYYFLSNGPEQFIKSEITYEEYQEVFLVPGLKKWECFKSRFVKYKDIIKLSNYEINLAELENAINEADIYINELTRMDREKILCKNINFFCEKVEKVKKIYDIINGIYRKLSLGQSII